MRLRNVRDVRRATDCEDVLGDLGLERVGVGDHEVERVSESG